MKFRYLLIIFQLFLCCAVGFGQKNTGEKDNDVPKVDESKINPTNLSIARFQINDIKTRGIIVRLRTDKNRIDTYRRVGNNKVADKLEEKTKLTNMILEYAFITNWSYSPVYFMESQNTATLMQKDTLIAKTFDLQRDTMIYMNHDSLYIVDYGELIINYSDGKKSLNTTSESGTPEPGWYMVVKDHDQNQLQAPIPYKAKVWGDAFGTTDKLIPIVFPDGLADSISVYLKRYSDINEMLHSNAKRPILKYLALVYDHVSIAETVDTSHLIAFKREKSSTDEHVSVKKIWGDPYTEGALRLNKHFIEYYCERLDKDKNILSRTDLLYWWLKNPNIRYLPYIHDLEAGLKKSLDKESSFIKLH